MAVQDIIKKRRLELDLTLKDVSKALGVTEGTVSRYESGDIQNMGIDKVANLAKVLRCSPGYLMGWQSSPEEIKKEDVSLSDEEMEVIMAYRRADDVARIMVQRSLGIEELLEYKTRNTPPNENLEILRKKA